MLGVWSMDLWFMLIIVHSSLLKPNMIHPSHVHWFMLMVQSFSISIHLKSCSYKSSYKTKFHLFKSYMVHSNTNLISFKIANSIITNVQTWKITKMTCWPNVDFLVHFDQSQLNHFTSQKILNSISNLQSSYLFFSVCHWCFNGQTWCLSFCMPFLIIHFMCTWPTRCNAMHEHKTTNRTTSDAARKYNQKPIATRLLVHIRTTSQQSHKLAVKAKSEQGSMPIL